MDEISVRTEGLCKRFGPIRAVDGLELEVRAGEIFGLVGSDGAGKTTTMRLLAGLLQPDAGSVSVAGIDVLSQPEQVRRRLGYLPQTFALHGHLSIDENIDYFADLFCQDRAEMAGRRRELLQATDLAEFADRRADALSGGMRQKAALICALIHRPQVLLLDEPTRGVDPVSRRDLWRIVYGLPTEGVTVLVATPDADEAERCGRLGVIAEGRIIDTGTPQQLVERHTAGLIEVAADRPQAAREVLRGVGGVRGVSALGASLRVSVAEDGPDCQALRGMLQERGIEVHEARAIEPGLEDALLVLEAERGG
ncbi:MAG: ABC transporter ATP-binding protein [Armatimonadota bacterium]|nr:ABC transporter ATP-binding protein [Armatimonadota bacterium]